MFSFISKIHNKKKQEKRNKLDLKINLYIEEISEKLKINKEINFAHSGHLGDLINSLPVIKEISKNKKCNLFVNINKKIDISGYGRYQPSKEFFLTKNSYEKLFPLLNSQNYLSRVEVYKEQKIDIDLDYFRELPLNFNIDSVRWYAHLTGVNPELSSPYLLNIKINEKYKDKIVFMRSLRRQNNHINFKFLEKYRNLIFIGLEKEFIDLKKQISNLEFYDCADFLEMAEIIKSSRLFIGNLSFGYTIAEALKTPRLLESYLDFPLVYPNGLNGREFYFQAHFEKFVKEIIKN